MQRIQRNHLIYKSHKGEQVLFAQSLEGARAVIRRVVDPFSFPDPVPAVSGFHG